MENMHIVYKIERATDKNGNEKELSVARRTRRYQIYSAVAGMPAWLLNIDNEKESMRTSNVEKIVVMENTVALMTMNTVYYLKPVIEGV
jgi:hypothetical protein